MLHYVLIPEQKVLIMFEICFVAAKTWSGQKGSIRGAKSRKIGDKAKRRQRRMLLDNLNPRQCFLSYLMTHNSNWQDSKCSKNKKNLSRLSCFETMLLHTEHVVVIINTPWWLQTRRGKWNLRDSWHWLGEYDILMKKMGCWLSNTSCWRWNL